MNQTMTVRFWMILMTMKYKQVSVTELYLKYSEWALRFHSFLRTTHFFNSFGLMLYIFLKKISIVNPFWDVLQTKCKMFFKKTTLIYCVLCYECFEVLALSFSLLLLIFFQNLLNKFLKDFWWLPQKCWRSIVFCPSFDCNWNEFTLCKV